MVPCTKEVDQVVVTKRNWHPIGGVRPVEVMVVGYTGIRGG